MLDDGADGRDGRRHLVLGEFVGLGFGRLRRFQICERVEPAEEAPLVPLASRRVPVNVAAVRVCAALAKQGDYVRMVGLAEAGDEQRRVVPSIERIHIRSLIEEFSHASDVAFTGCFM